MEQRLAGHGSSAAFVSAGAAAVVLLTWNLERNLTSYAPIETAIAVTVGYFLALFLWVGAFNVILFDLEYREGPAANIRWLRIAGFTARLAIVASLLVPIVVLTQAYGLYTALYALMFLAVGAVLFAQDIEARRARLLRGLLPWLGMTTGVVFIVVGLTWLAVYFTPEVAYQVMLGMPFVTQVGTTPVLIEVDPQNLAELLYIVWAVWLGVKLSRATAVAPAPAL